MIALTILIFTFEIPEQRKVIGIIDNTIQRRIRQNRFRFIDKLELESYLGLLGHQFERNEAGFETLRTFFDELIKNASLDGFQYFKQRWAKFKRYFELMVEESGYRIEKPDRIFLYADSLNVVTQFAESLFDSDKMKKKVSFNKAKWDYQLSKSFDNLRIFWVTCMMGLFTFGQTLDRFIVLYQASEKVQKEVNLPQTTKEEDPVTTGKKFSNERINKAKKFSFKGFLIKPTLKLAPTLNKIMELPWSVNFCSVH